MSLSTVITFVTQDQNFLFVGAVFFVVSYLFSGRKKKSNRHHFKIEQGNRALKKIRTFHHESQQIGYLRKINAFAFEELLLSALEDAGAKIKRNSKYTGDGGIDGKCKFYGQKYFIQAKRYKSYISASDVHVFSLTCRKNGVKGLFIHTGKTGKKSHEEKSDNVDIISSDRLLLLVISRQLPKQ